MIAEADDAGAATALPWLELPPWHESLLDELLAGRATLPHALLIHGPAGIGKHAFALALAQALLCEAPQPDGRACGQCPGCRYARAGQHPDLMRLERLVLDEETGELALVETIGIDRVRRLIDFIQLTSHRRGRKVAVIAPADRMNTSAANALLKTLEEPPAGTHLLLVTDQPGRLPATVVSRCRRFPLPEPGADVARRWLDGQGAEDAALLLAQAGGAPLAALALADAALLRERRAWLEALANPERLSPLQLSARIDAAGRDDRKARLQCAIDWLLAWTSDLARLSAGGSVERNPDFSAELAALAPRVASVPLFRYHRALLRQRAVLAHPLQPRLVAEALLLDYQALFTPSS